MIVYALICLLVILALGLVCKVAERWERKP